MGWLGDLLGTSAEARVVKARKLLERGDYNGARWEASDLDHPQAGALLEQARSGLAQLNLEEANARFSAGDEEGAKIHLEMAKEFGASAEDLRVTRRRFREARERARRMEARQEQAAEASFVPVGDDPLWGLPPNDPRIRYALRVETYPAELRDRLAGLGPEFASAVLLLEDGKAQKAWDALTPFVGRDPVARYERSRAALAGQRTAAAASDLASFGDAFGHCRIGQTHTAGLLAELWHRMGRTQEALELLEGQPAGDVDLGVLMAHLIEATGDLSRARELAERLLRKAPKALPLHRLRARVLLAEGDRIGAMQTLDTALSQLCSSGKCGTQPFDVEAGRMLARLYLEDRVEPRRARELMGELSRATQKPGWTDRYLQALAARNAEEPEAVDMARRLLSELREQTDPRRAWITRSFEQLRQASLPG